MVTRGRLPEDFLGEIDAPPDLPPVSEQDTLRERVICGNMDS